MNNLPYKYYFYGSKSSLDKDVIISISKDDFPKVQEERKILLRKVLDAHKLNWNSVFAVFNGGVIVDTMYPKTWVDSLNNSLFHTYKYHKQDYPNPVVKTLPRNVTLAIYKAVRTILALMTRTDQRTAIRPIIRGIHPFNKKLEKLKNINFFNYSSFNQKNTSDVDIWKTIAFYVIQNILLIKGIEIYTKEEAVSYYPELSNFIMRNQISELDKFNLTNIKNRWINTIETYKFVSQNSTLHNIDNGEVINMVKEITI